MAIFRGVEANQEVSSTRVYQDTRAISVKIIAWLLSVEGITTMLFAYAIIGFILPTLMESFVLIAGVHFYAFKNKLFRLPVRLPISSGLRDPSDPHPKTLKPEPASGIAFLGRDRSNSRGHVYFAKKDICTHMVMMATTGGGKTEALLGMAANSMVQGSGFTFVDGKADVTLLAKILWMAHTFGRMEDVLVVNYNTGGQDVGFDTPDQKLSNTLNPFMFGSSGSLTELLVSLMSDSGGKGDFWKDRAISLVQAIIPALVWLRDKRGLLLDVSVIREYLNLPRILELRRITEMPQSIQESLRAYCENLAGWNERKGAQQGDTTMEQHGFLQMQFTRVLGSLGDVYGHIFKTALGEVDMYDVITNRRILLVMLPALEKSTSELQNLGRIIVALIKSMMAAALGGKIEGDVFEVLDDRFTNADTPYQTIFDEYGAYSVDGSSVMPAQARSLNIQMVFAGQDYPAFSKSGKENADSIIANCNIKAFGKLEDSGETFKIARESAGEAVVSKARGHEMDTGFLQTYKADRNSSFDTVNRLNLVDLRQQKEGQFHVMFGTTLMRLDLFYTNPGRPLKRMDINHLLPVRSPTPDALTRINESMNLLISKLKCEDEFIEQLSPPAESRDIRIILNALSEHADMPNTQRAAAVVASYHRANVSNAEGSIAEEEDFADMLYAEPTHMNVFSPAPDGEFDPTEQMLEMTRNTIKAEKGGAEKLLEATLGAEYAQEGAKTIAMMSGLIPNEVQEGIQRIESALMNSEVSSMETAHRVTASLEQSTNYPGVTPEVIASEEYQDVIGMLENIIQTSDEQE